MVPTAEQRMKVLYLLRNNEKEVDDGAHRCVEDVDPLDATHQ